MLQKLVTFFVQEQRFASPKKNLKNNENNCDLTEYLEGKKILLKLFVFFAKDV